MFRTQRDAAVAFLCKMNALIVHTKGLPEAPPLPGVQGRQGRRLLLQPQNRHLALESHLPTFT